MHRLPSLLISDEAAPPSLAPSLWSSSAQSHMPPRAGRIKEETEVSFSFSEFHKAENFPHVGLSSVSTHGTPLPSSARTLEHNFKGAFTFGGYSAGQQISDLHPSMYMTKEKPPPPVVKPGAIASLPVRAVWSPFNGQDCIYCLSFRDIIYENEQWTTKLSLHAISGVPQHAVLVIHPLVQVMPDKKYTADLRSMDAESVEKMLIDYSTYCVQDGLNFVRDSNWPFLESIAKRMDKSYQPIPMELMASSTAGYPNHVSKNLNQNLSEIAYPKTLAYDDSLEKNLSAYGLKSAAGPFKEITENVPPIQWNVNKTKRERARTITLEEISKYFHLTISEAAKELNVCNSVLKKICRKFNINRWPYRKILAARKWSAEGPSYTTISR